MREGDDMDKRELAKISAVTGTLIPTPGPNRVLPPLNPLKARSTYAAFLAVLAILAPFLNGGLGEIVTDILKNGDAAQDHIEKAVDAANVLIGFGALVWYALERRAPNYRLSFKRH